MMFTAGKDLNALREVLKFHENLYPNILSLQYIKKEYRHSEIDQCFTFKLDPSLGYVELIFDGLQSKPTTGWSVIPHMEPCQVNYLTKQYYSCIIADEYVLCRLVSLTWLVLKGSATLILHHVE